jgi:hypothetical protein
VRRLRSWYISYAVPRGTEMTIAKDRGTAIEIACELLRDGVDVLGAGPMVEEPAGKVITGEQIRSIAKMRRAA